jgi:heme exporter protein A
MDRMALRDLADRRAANLSAGQKRRLGLARLLVSGRAIWVMDEPTVSLDTASVQLFATVVRDHLAAGGAALIATHIDLGLEADLLDLTPFKARKLSQGGVRSAFDEAFI